MVSVEEADHDVCCDAVLTSAAEHHGHDHAHDHGHSDDHVDDHHEPEAVDLEPIETHNTKDQNGNAFPTHAEHRHNAAQLKKPGRDLGMLGVLVHGMPTLSHPRMWN